MQGVATRSRERAQRERKKGIAKENRGRKKKAHHHYLIDGRLLNFFLLYLEERVQPFDLDHPPVAREVGPVAGGAFSGCCRGRRPRRSGGGHGEQGREKERGEEEEEKKEEARDLIFFYFFLRTEQLSFSFSSLLLSLFLCLSLLCALPI